MASTTEEMTGQSDQLISALGFFKTGENAAPLKRLQEAVSRPSHPAPAGSRKQSSKGGVALKMRDDDAKDQDFERY